MERTQTSVTSPSQQATSKTTQTLTTQNLVNYAHTLGITVRYTNLPKGTRGLWSHTTQSIHLDHHLTDRQTRSLLAHELAHALLGHQGPQDAVREQHAWRYAADLLIPAALYREAELLHGQDTYAIADELDVTHEIIDAYRTSLKARRAA
ncbi:ImmA/IrrE family metallo-endopeptidase [Dermabacteraceae bacterium P7006]